MGMYGTLRRATADDVARLRANPAHVGAFLHGEPPVMVDAGPRGLLGFLLRLTPLKVQRPADDPAPVAPLWPPAGPDETLDLDKTWHGLHFLLTGEASGGTEPASFLLEGGEPVDEDDDDLLARLLAPAQVRAFAEHLAALTTDELRRRYDPARMTALRIYPDPIWERDDPEESIAWLLDSFEGLRDFMADAAAAGDAVVIGVA